MNSGMRFCLRCDGPCRGCKPKSQSSDTVTRTLALLERGNLSPPFSRVASWLFVGDLRSLFTPPPEVTHIVSLLDFTVELQLKVPRLVVNLDDADMPESAAAMVAAVVQIDTWFAKGAVLLVHCVEGRSRSAAVAIGLLMRREKLEFGGAFSIVKEARSRIAPRQCFLEALSNEPWK